MGMAGMVFHMLPGSSLVRPMDSWQVFSTAGCRYL